VTISPLIQAHSWGRLQVADLGVFRDAKLFPGGARTWDWRETDTHHDPGIQLADVEELVRSGAEEVVLSRGVELRLQVPRSLVVKLESRGLVVHVLRTPEAIELYNELAVDRPVGALIHSTC